MVRTAHSQMTSVLQLRARNAFNCRSSLSWFLSIFPIQNSCRVLGILKYRQLWPCQKQPWIKTAALYFGSTISGVPGRFFTCTRKRKPLACRAFRIKSSGEVFLLRIFAIILERVSASTTSVKISSALKIKQRLQLQASLLTNPQKHQPIPTV